MTTHLRWPLLSLPKQIPLELLLYKMKTVYCDQWPLFLSPKWKQKQPKTTTTKLYLTKKEETNIRQECIKNKHLFDYIYSSATL